MIKYKTFMKEHFEVDYIECDSCNKKIDQSDRIELQETLYISFIAGYGTVFEDGEEYETQLCQHCVKKILGKFLREVK